MIFWIFVILLVVGVALLIINEVCSMWSDGLSLAGFVVTMLSAVAVIVSLVVIIGNNLTAEGYRAANEERYKALIYKAQADRSRDEFGIANKSFIDEIQDWNEDVAEGKALQRDFWVGIFYPNIYDNFETIDINSIAYKED